MDNPIACEQIEGSMPFYAESGGKYVNVPAKLLVGCLREVPFILGSMCYCLQLVIYLFSQYSITVPLPELLVDIHPVDSLPLVLILHQQVRVVVHFLGIEMDV
jgi:hypothetical protein